MYSQIATSIIFVILPASLGLLPINDKNTSAVIAEPPVAISATATPLKVETEGEIVAYIEKVFGNDSKVMLAIAKCESSLNPNAKNKTSTASGIFQIIKSTFEGTGKDWNKRFEARENIEAAKIIFDKRGTQPWECR